MNVVSSPCPGCGLLLPQHDGPTHRYLGASAACWDLFGQVLAREFGDPAYWPPHALTVDTYAAQHPGVRGPQTTHSATFHLMGLCMVVERGLDVSGAASLRQRAVDAHKERGWLEPPASLGSVTVRNVLAATTPEEHADMVRTWAASVWEAWAAHHEIVREWVDRVERGA